MLTVAEIESGRDGLRATQRAFLDALAASGSMTVAAKRVGVPREVPYGWMYREGFSTGEEEEAPEGSFTHACLLAKRQAADAVLGRTYEEALSDSAGMPAAVQRMFIVKRWMPEYRDQLSVKHSGAVLQARVDLDALDADARAFLLHRMAQQLGGQPPAQLPQGGVPDTPTDEAP